MQNRVIPSLSRSYGLQQKPKPVEEEVVVLLRVDFNDYILLFFIEAFYFAGSLCADVLQYNTWLADTKPHATRRFPLRLFEVSGVEDCINHTLRSRVVLNTGVPEM